MKLFEMMLGVELDGLSGQEEADAQEFHRVIQTQMSSVNIGLPKIEKFRKSMKNTSELTGKELDEWTARAIGFESSARVPDELCGEWYAGESDGGTKDWNPSTDIHQFGLIFAKNFRQLFAAHPEMDTWPKNKDELMVFVCRELVRLKFGDVIYPS